MTSAAAETTAAPVRARARQQRGMTNERTQAHSRGSKRGVEGIQGNAVMLRLDRLAAWTLVLGCLSGHGVAQAAEAIHGAGPAESLYSKLRLLGLDAGRVYKVREAALQGAALHISLDDGTIAFTEDAGGHITGAFFKGDGEVLLFPPNTTERASLALFTGAAILEEKFSTAYFRFNEDVFA